MIKCNKGSIEISGNGAQLITEYEMLSRKIREVIEKSLGKEDASALMDEVYRSSKLSEEEFIEENIGEIMGTSTGKDEILKLLKMIMKL